MSGWSAVGLADRSAVENLIEQIESLRWENKELSAENQRLIAAQISENYVSLYNVENQNVQFLASGLSELRKDLSAQIEGLSRLVYQQLEVNNDAAQANIQSAERKLRADISVVQDSVNKYSVQQEKNRQEEKSQLSEIAAQLTESQKRQSEMIQEISNQLEVSLNQIMASQNSLSDQSCQSIAKSNESLISRVEQYCTLALEEVRKTAENYKQIGQDEQEHLDKIRTLSDDMLELGEHQKIVMENLSRLCQHSEQFMEIQKSINDIWEIMKAVWVDSLLNDLEKNLQSAYSGSNPEEGDNAHQSDSAENADMFENYNAANEALSGNNPVSFTEEVEDILKKSSNSNLLWQYKNEASINNIKIYDAVLKVMFNRRNRSDTIRVAFDYLRENNVVKDSFTKKDLRSDYILYFNYFNKTRNRRG